MCHYILLHNLCGCYGPLFAGECCILVYHQLHRINDAAAWDDESRLPFDMPDHCCPGWHNTRIQHTNAFCRLLETCPAILNPEFPFWR